MMLAPASVMIFLSAVLNVDATSLPYFDPSQSTSLAALRRGSGSIPGKVGEKLLLVEEGSAIGCSTLIVLVNKEFALVQRDIHGVVEQRSGIAEEHENLAGPIPPPPEERPPYAGRDDYPPWPELGEALAVLTGTKSSSPIREYEVLSQAYNRMESGKAFSEVRIRVSDGRQLFGKAVSILQLKRRDYSREWARFHHALPFPLPYKEDLAFTVVTSTEVDLVEQLKKRNPGLALRYFVLSAGDISLFADYKATVLGKMREAVSQFGAE